MIRSTDPITKKEILIAPDGYNASEDDDVHKCDDAKPSVSSLSFVSNSNSGLYRIDISFAKGRFDLQEATVSVDGQQIEGGNASSGRLSVYFKFTKPDQKITVRVKDSGGYVSEKSYDGPKDIPSGGSDDSDDDD